MNQSKLEITVGAFVIVGLAAVAYLALRIGAGVLVGADTYVVNARFTNVSGLNAGSKVAISGVTVGSVEAVTVNPDDFAAVVAMRLRSNVRLPIDSSVALRANGLLGDRHLAIKPGVSEELVPAGGMLERTSAAMDLESLIAQFTGGGSAESAIGSDSYVVHARFGNVTGLSSGCRIAIAGIPIGVVEAVRLSPDDYSAIVDMRLRGDVKLPTDSMVSVKSSSLIGGKFLSVSPGADTEMVTPGGTLIETESSLDLESLVSRIAFGSVQQKEQP